MQQHKDTKPRDGVTYILYNLVFNETYTVYFLPKEQQAAEVTNVEFTFCVSFEWHLEVILQIIVCCFTGSICRLGVQ